MNDPTSAEVCLHDDLSRLSCEPEGYEDPTEPLQIHIVCGVCGLCLNVAIQDVAFQEWAPE